MGVKPVMKYAFLVTVLIAVSGCSGTWSNTNVEAAPGTSGVAANTATAVKKDPASIVVTKADITDKPYNVIADIEVTVNKTTIFHPDPTPELVDQKLREEAAELGADAVVLVRYGSVGMSLLSWGSLDGKGRAVAFK